MLIKYFLKEREREREREAYMYIRSGRLKRIKAAAKRE